MRLIPAVSALVCDGLFGRFPRLEAATLESGASYASYLMDRLDEKYDRFGRSDRDLHALVTGSAPAT